MWVDISEAPVQISIREMLDAPKTDEFCRDILSGQGRGTVRIIEDDDGVLRRIIPQEGGTKQIVIPEALRPRLFNPTHHEKLTGHPGQKKIYARL